MKLPPYIMENLAHHQIYQRHIHLWTRAELAAESGISLVTINDIERVRRKDLKLSTFEALGQAFHLDSPYLLSSQSEASSLDVKHCEACGQPLPENGNYVSPQQRIVYMTEHGKSPVYIASRLQIPQDICNMLAGREYERLGALKR